MEIEERFGTVEIATFIAELQANTERLNRAELACRNTAIGLKAYESQLQRDLRDFRSQRAWQVMLFVRKAYTYLVRNGWKGRAEFVKELLGVSPRRPLAEFDLEYPNIRAFLPPELWAIGRPGAPGTTGRSLRVSQRQTKYDVVILPVFDFEFRFQRPQQLALQFARAGHRVFWPSPSRTLAASSGAQYEITPLRENIWEVHLRVPRRDIYTGSLSRADIHSYTQAFAALYRDQCVASSCVLVQLPFWRQVALGLRDLQDARILFDCMDDWETMPDLSSFNTSEESALVRDCDTLVVSSRQLQTKHEGLGKDPVLVRNGADFDFFASGRSAPELAGITRPIVGYFGAIAEWFDYDLMIEVARARPHYSFVLIGGLGLEEHATGTGTARLRQVPNIRLLGHKPYSDIPSYAAAFDVCMIPFVVNQVTSATDPVKLYEYFSLGKPVVATPMGELSQCADLLYRAGTPGEFASALDTAIAEADPDLHQRRIEFARANSWTHRFETMDLAIRKSFRPVSVVIVTHNSERFVRPCFDSLRRNTSYPECEFIVVDNASTDGTVALVEAYAAVDPRFKTVFSDANTGFAGGNNLGAREATGEYLILLNVDTIVTPGWIERLLRHLWRDPSIGLLVPVTNSAGNELKIDVPYTDDGEMEEFALKLAADRNGENFDIECGPLFCAVMPRKVWNEVGDLDERFGVGMFEDDDFSIRVRNGGYRVAGAEDCFVHHFGQGAFSKLQPARYQAIFDQNRAQFEAKWGKPWTPHVYRPGVRAEGGRFTPEEFVRQRKAAAGSH